MATTQYMCRDRRRRDRVAAATNESGQAFLNGIDFLEVSPAGHQTLVVHFVHPLPGQAGGVPAAPALTPGNFRIEGGVRITDVRVEAVAGTAGSVITLTTSRAGDFSTYTLRLVTSPVVDDVPAGFDPQLADVPFSFKIHCEGEFDCGERDECPPPSVPAPAAPFAPLAHACFASRA